MFKFSEYLPFLLNRVVNRMVAAGSPKLRDFDLTLQSWRVLASLYSKEGQRISDLASSTSIEIWTVSRTVDALEDKKLVVRFRDRPGARSVRVRLTPKGHELVQQVIPSALHQEAVMLEGVSDRERDMLVALLERIHDNLMTAETDERQEREVG